MGKDDVMVTQGFSIGKRDWYIMCSYDINSERELKEVKKTLLSAGLNRERADEAVWVLSMWNKGYTFTNFKDHLTLMFMSKATSAEQMYDSIQHELRHTVDHLCEYYGVQQGSEEAAYLQGEIGRKMFKAAALVVCPGCNSHLHELHEEL